MDGWTPKRGGDGSHGFWGPGESTTGVERPSTLMEGMCTCALPLDGNWKESLAGLRGAIGLRVLQKWMLGGSELGVSSTGVKVCVGSKDGVSAGPCA